MLYLALWGSTCQDEHKKNWAPINENLIKIMQKWKKFKISIVCNYNSFISDSVDSNF